MSDRTNAERQANLRQRRREEGLAKVTVWVHESNRERLKEIARELLIPNELLIKISERFGSAAAAAEWYRSKPIPGFGGKTAMELVDAGRLDEVLEFVDATDAGVHS